MRIHRMHETQQKLKDTNQKTLEEFHQTTSCHKIRGEFSIDSFFNKEIEQIETEAHSQMTAF